MDFVASPGVIICKPLLTLNISWPLFHSHLSIYIRLKMPFASGLLHNKKMEFCQMSLTFDIKSHRLILYSFKDPVFPSSNSIDSLQWTIYPKSIRPSILYTCLFLCTCSLTTSAYHRAEGGVTPWSSRQLVTGPHGGKQSHAHSLRMT